MFVQMFVLLVVLQTALEPLLHQGDTDFTATSSKIKDSLSFISLVMEEVEW